MWNRAEAEAEFEEHFKDLGLENYFRGCGTRCLLRLKTMKEIKKCKFSIDCQLKLISYSKTKIVSTAHDIPWLNQKLRLNEVIKANFSEECLTFSECWIIMNADSFQCMTKPTTIKIKNKNKNK